MFSPAFDTVIAVICGVLSVVFLLGKGRKVLDLFGAGSQPRKKRTPEKELRYQRGIACFLIPLTIVEIVSVLHRSATMGFVLVIVTIVDLVVYVTVIRKRTE